MPARYRGVVALAPILMMAIAVANSALHWHSIFVLYALTAVLIIGVAVVAFVALRKQA